MNSQFGKYTLITILILAIIIICYYPHSNKCKSSEHMINVSYDGKQQYQRNKCDYMMNASFNDVLKQYNINEDVNGSIIFPCGYDEINKEINEMPVKDNAKYYIIHDADMLASKEWLWLHNVRHHGLKKAQSLMPNSYVLYLQDDVNRFNNEYDPNKIYITKKNIQRQEGLAILNDKQKILEKGKEGYVLIQELLQDPYIIGDRKTNMRFYVLVLCKEGNIDVFVYNDGFMYYSKDPFITGSLSFGPNITTGYIDRWIYDVNPLTHQDLIKYLDKDRQLSSVEQNIRNQGLKISQVYFNRIYQLLHEIFVSFVGKICTGQKLKNNLTFQLFGVDIAVNDQLQPMIMEINKGPDLGTKDERDGKVKKSVLADMMRLVGVIDDKGMDKNGFIRILDVENGNINSKF